MVQRKIVRFTTGVSRSLTFLIVLSFFLAPLSQALAAQKGNETSSTTPSGIPPGFGGGGVESMSQPFVGDGGSTDVSQQIYNGGRYSDIDQLSGTYSFAIPISIPPGRSGTEPQLSLQYNSQPQYETSVVGYGWSLSIPFIERINKRGTDKMFSDTYFYSSLSGELASTSATTYRTKTENGTFIAYEFQSNAWTATDRNGTLYKFGYATTSRQDHPNNTSTTSKWMLQEMRDKNGNYVSYSYYKEDGQIYPATITYTHSSSSADGIFEIEFNRESRTHSTSSAQGFSVVTKQQIAQIVAKVNGTWVRKYELDYTTPANRTKSLLSTVTEYGRADDGSTTTRPAYQFSYQESSPKEWRRDNSWTPPTHFVDSDSVSLGAMFADANGDGRPDVLKSLLRAGVSTRVVYLNNGTSTGGGWTASSTWSYPWGPYFTADGVVQPFFPVDINADGYDDFIYSGSSTANNKIYINTKQGWATSTEWILPTTFINNEGATAARVVDINGDQLPDILRADENGSTSVVFLNTGSGWATSTTWALPQYFVSSSTDLGVVFSELNGDGLPDLVRSFKNTGPEPDVVVNLAYVNTGSGWATSTTWQNPDATRSMEDGIDKGFRMVDINGDAYSDILRGCSCWTAVRATYLNTNSGWTDLSSTWPLDYSWVDLAHHDNGSRFPDLDGDTLPDFFLSYLGISPEPSQSFIDMNMSKPVDLLTQITLPQGGSTTIEYKSTHQYRNGTTNLNTALPYPILTVATTTERDGLGNVAVTTFSYEGGRVYWNSPYDRKFAGFSMVTKTDPVGNVTKTYFHQGSTTESALGEYDDHVSKIGKPYRVEQYDSASNLYNTVITKWDKEDLGNGRYFTKPTEILSLGYEGDSDHLDTLETFSYATATGLLIEKIQWGQVTGTASGTYTDTGSDKFTTTYAYATSTPSNMYLPWRENVVDQSGTKVRESRFYYDSLATGTIDKGNLTKHEMWLSGTTYIDIEKTYNSLGLVATEKDARDKTTTYTYDTYNLYPATTTNALSHVTGRVFDYSSGKVRTLVTPNSHVYETSYDGFDRVIEEKQPDLMTPSTLVTRTLYSYTDTVLPRKVQKTDYLSSATSTDSYVYFDGFGRKVQERVEAEGSNTYSVKDSEFNKLGQLVRDTLPYFASSTAYGPTTTSLLNNTYTYDALGRVKTIANVLGTTTTAYDDWVATTTDVLGNYKSYTKDAYGNLVRVIERNNGSSYLTAYEYNGNNKLTKITDADASVRNFTYDGLGRRLTAQDLHDAGDGTYGTWTFVYDATGNIASTTDPKSQVVNYTYDDLNRVLTENYTGAAGTEVSYAYDTCTYGKGKLCSATTTDAVSRYAYNALGLTQSETKVLNSVAYSTSYTYDRGGNRIGIVYPDNGEVQYAHNSAGLLESVVQKENGGTFASVVSNFEYGPHGMTTITYYANGASTTKTYNASQLYRISSIATLMPTSTLGVGGGGPDLQLLEAELFGTTTSEEMTIGGVTESLPEEVNVPQLSETIYQSDEQASSSDSRAAEVPEVQSASSTETMSEQIMAVPPQESVVQDNELLTLPDASSVATTSEASSTTPLAPSILELLSDKSGDEAGAIKGREIAKIGSVPRETVRFNDAIYDIEVVQMEENDRGVTVFARAWTPQGEQVGFGKDGSIDIERFIIVNPPILVEDPQGDIVRTSINPDAEEKVYRFRVDPRTALLQSLAHTIEVKKQRFIDAPITRGKVGNTTTTVYPQANPATVAGDGYVSRLNTDITWSGARSAATGTAASVSDASIYITSELRASGKYEITRAFYNFDTSSLGTNQNVDSATFSLYNVGDSNDTDPHGLIQTTPASNTALTTGDYDSLTLNSPSEGASRVSSFPSITYYNWALNSTGLGWINKTGVTNLGVRMARDIDNTTPSARSYRAWYAAEHTSNDPKLVIEHSAIPAMQQGGFVLRYTYDAVGNITQVVNDTRNLSAATTSYTYDALYRLQTASTTFASTTPYRHTFTYSPVGNITGMATSGATTTYTYAETGYVNPHAPTQVGSTTLTYDNNGNVTVYGQTAYTWDYRNRMTATGKGGATTTYAYDHTYERVKKVSTTTTTYYPNDLYSKEGATTTRFVYGNGELLATIEGNGTATATRYYHPDHLGSTRLVSNNLGVAVQAMDYYPYGSTRITNGVYTAPRTYIGEIGDQSTQLMYLNARYADPSRGQFLSQDPVFWGNQNLANPQSLNSYSYAEGNPVNRKDPSGLATAKGSAKETLKAIEKTLRSLLKLVASYATNPIGTQISIAKSQVQTVKSASNAIAHPVQTYNTVSQSVSTFRNGTDAQQDAVIGSGVAFVAEMLVTRGAGKLLPKETLICRGGSCMADDFVAGTGVTKNVDGTLSGVSVLVGINGESKADLLSKLPARFNGQGSFTTIGNAQSTPAILIQTGSNPLHYEMNGLTPQGYENLFNQ